ncbi:MAG: universal stress protein [Cyanobacteria bacterium P01_F01_bin.150]
MDRILLTDAGVGNSEDMLKFLLDIPVFQRSKVTVLHVVAPQTSALKMEQKKQEGDKIIARSKASLPLDSLRADWVLQEGDPKIVVCRVAERLEPNLIIMGSRGLNRLEAVFQNSVSQYVFQSTSCSILQVKDNSYVKKIRKVLVAINKSEISEQALDLALAMVRDIKGGRLVFVHVREELPRRTTNKSEIELDDKPADQNPILAPAVARAKRLGLKYQCEAPKGKAGESISQLADELNVDLVVMGSPEKRPAAARQIPDLERLIGKSVSDYVRVKAPCPVLLLR